MKSVTFFKHGFCSIGMVERDIPKTGNLEFICLKPEYNSVFHTDCSFIAVLSPFPRF